MKYQKIFVIGYNKTGTKSFHKLFTSLGFSSQHNRKGWEINNCKCFSDGFHDKGKFIEYDQKFENSLFILNTRPLNNWLKSRSKHGYCHLRRGVWPPSSKQYIEWIQQRDEHFNEIIDYFYNKNDRLLICNIEKDGWENFIASNLMINNTKNYNIHENKIEESKIDAEAVSLINEELDKAYLNLGYGEEDKNKLLPNNQYISLYKQYL